MTQVQEKIFQQSEMTKNILFNSIQSLEYIEDPGFRDPANADFTISNPTHINRKCGDPRWLP